VFVTVDRLGAELIGLLDRLRSQFAGVHGSEYHPGARPSVAGPGNLLGRGAIGPLRRRAPCCGQPRARAAFSIDLRGLGDLDPCICLDDPGPKGVERPATRLSATHDPTRKPDPTVRRRGTKRRPLAAHVPVRPAGLRGATPPRSAGTKAPMVVQTSATLHKAHARGTNPNPQ
jgi:hypothetical protein